MSTTYKIHANKDRIDWNIEPATYIISNNETFSMLYPGILKGRRTAEGGQLAEASPCVLT